MKVGSASDARCAVEAWGKKLLGKFVFTEAMGSWPGGAAMIVEVEPDKEAPEIPIMVYGLEPEEHYKKFDEPDDPYMGVFEYELIEFVDGRKLRNSKYYKKAIKKLAKSIRKEERKSNGKKKN